jgi:hypothetical protein
MARYFCSMCAPRVTRHTSIRHSSSYHTRVNMGALIFFTAAMIRALRTSTSHHCHVTSLYYWHGALQQ